MCLCLLYPFFCIGHLGAFRILAVLSSAAMDVVVHVCFQVSICVCVCVCVCFSKMSPGGEMLDHVVVAILFFLRNLCAVLHSGYPILHSHKKSTRVPYSLHLPRHLLFVHFDGGHSD